MPEILFLIINFFSDRLIIIFNYQSEIVLPQTFCSLALDKTKTWLLFCTVMAGEGHIRHFCFGAMRVSWGLACTHTASRGSQTSASTPSLCFSQYISCHCSAVCIPCVH